MLTVEQKIEREEKLLKVAKDEGGNVAKHEAQLAALKKLKEPKVKK